MRQHLPMSSTCKKKKNLPDSATHENDLSVHLIVVLFTMRSSPFLICLPRINNVLVCHIL